MHGCRTPTYRETAQAARHGPGTDPDLLSRLRSVFGDRRVIEVTVERADGTAVSMQTGILLLEAATGG